MTSWQFVCLLFFNLWRVQVWAGPANSGLSAPYNTRYSAADYQKPNHLLNYLSIPDHGVHHSQNDTFPIAEHFIADKNDKRNPAPIKTTRIRRTPTGFSARGFHEEVFDRDFGHFSPVKRSDFEKRRPEADAAGFYGDTFSNGFGEFETMKRRYPSQGVGYKMMTKADMDPRYMLIPQRFFKEAQAAQETGKRSPEMTKSGFHSDLFNGGFGEFHPMRK